MAEKIKTKKNKNLKNKFRFVVLNDETFEEKFSLSLTRTNVWVFLGVASFTLIFLTASAIIYTPLKYFIPGFGDYNYRSQILQLQFKTDSLVNTMQARQAWLENLASVVEGQIDTTKPKAGSKADVEDAKGKLNNVSETDRELRKEVEEEENFALTVNAGKGGGVVDEVKRMHPIAPVVGSVTDEYEPIKEHYGIDIATKQDEPIKAVLDGKVIAAGYTLENGHVITVQHANNLVSIYKHNARLARKEGDAIKAGEVIGFVGNTGENSTGPHLHFELWHEGKSLNPREYIVF